MNPVLYLLILVPVLAAAGLERDGSAAGKRTNGSTPPAAKPHKKQLGADDDRNGARWISRCLRAGERRQKQA